MIQCLRAKTQDAGNLKTTKEQTVIVEEKFIRIEPANSEINYVPANNPTVVYGAWPYPAYPPNNYYQPGYVASSMFWFAAGVGMSTAWGYAWGNNDYRGGNVNIDNSRNTNINRNIDRGKYTCQLPSGGRGNWQHNPEHPKAFPIVTKELRRSLTARAPMTRLNHASSFVDEQNNEGKISVEEILATVAPAKGKGWAAVAEWLIAPARANWVAGVARE